MRRIATLALFCLLLANAKSQNDKTVMRMCGVANRDYLPLSRTTPKPIPFNAARLIDNNGVITIPVVVHAIHTSPADYVPDAAIFSQIAQTNIDLRMLNLNEIANIPPVWSGVPADAKLELKLACIAPDGSPTNGIERFVDSDPRPKSLTYITNYTSWPVDTYLNIWIFNSAFFYGWGNPPPGDPLNPNVPEGIALNFQVVGQGNVNPYFNQGKVLAHEIGHWLGLNHPHNQDPANGITCADDGVADTPMQGENNITTCPTYPKNDICNSDPHGVMFMNYMDYCNDPCKYMFTNGQVARMRSYIADPTTPFTRYEKLRNYFGFGNNLVKDYTFGACQNFSIKVSNPMCLPYTPILTLGQGLVTIVGHTLHSITLKVKDGVACTGNFSIEITSPNYNYTDLGRFTYTVAGCTGLTPSCGTPQVWPKVYEATNDYIAQPIVTNGSLFFTGFPAFNAGNNINHNGPIPPNPIGAATLNYHINSGATTMAINNMEPIFALSNGYVQVARSPFLTSPPTLSYNTSIYDGATGQVVTSPIPLNERILAETTDGYFITHTDTVINVLNPINGAVTNSKALTFSTNKVSNFYNAATKKLYIYNSVNQSHQWYVYTYNDTTKTLGNPVTFTYDIEKVAQITNGDLLIVNRGTTLATALLESYDYINNQHSSLPATIGNFANANFLLNRYLGNNTQDLLLVHEYNNNKLWLINLVANTAKYIDIIPSPGCYTYLGYAFLGSDIILSGWGYGAPVTIRGQTMYVFPPMYNYISKFNINNDFNRVAAVVPPKLGDDMKFNIYLSPNPAQNSLMVNVEKAFAKTAIKYEVEIKDTWGMVRMRASRYQQKFALDIAQLPTGLYHLTIIHSNGQKLATSFVKE